MRLPTVLKVLALSVLTLTGCGTDKETTTSSTKSKSNLIVDVKFDNPRLASCVKYEAETQKAIYTEELKTLNCSSSVKAQYEYDRPDLVIKSTQGLDKLVGLEQVDLSNNWISELDLTKLKHLTHLQLSNNIIQKLDLSKNPKLTVAALEHNPLYEVNLPISSELFDLRIGDHFTNGNFTTLSLINSGTVSEMKGITDDFYDINTGQFLSQESYTRSPHIDFSTQKYLNFLGLTDIDSPLEILKTLPTENSIRVLKLDLYNNSSPIPILDLPALPKLEELSAHNRGIKTIVFQAWPKLKQLSLSSNQLSEQAVTGINSLNAIEMVDLSFNDDIKWAATSTSPIKDLYLSGAQDNNVFQGMENLENLSLSYGQITGSLLDASSSKLKTLHLNNIAIMGKLKLSCTHLVELNLYRVNIESLNMDNCRTDLLEVSASTFGSDDVNGFNFSKIPGLKALRVWGEIDDGQLLLPADIEELSITGPKWESFELANVDKLTKLEIESMDKLKSIDLAQFKYLNDLKIARCNSLTHLDLRPLADMTGHLSLHSLDALQSLSATGLEHLSSAYITSLRSLNTTDRENLEKLTTFPKSTDDTSK